MKQHDNQNNKKVSKKKKIVKDVPYIYIFAK